MALSSSESESESSGSLVRVGYRHLLLQGPNRQLKHSQGKEKYNLNVRTRLNCALNIFPSRVSLHLCS